MVKMEDKVPKMAERVIIEEYYNFFKIVNCEKVIKNKKRTFSTVISKLNEKDLSDVSLIDAIRAVKNEDENIKFLTVYDTAENLSAVARIKFNEGNIHLCDVVFVNYPDVLEKFIDINEIMYYLIDLGIEYDVNDISMEILKSEDALVKFIENNGFTYNVRDVSKYHTVVLIKNLRKKELDGPTLSRKQTS